jgi:menaquinone-9 beta-reductase
MDRYDVIVVGARVAGAATALLLARAGHRVVVLDRARRGSDTLSTHALMRPAVLQLERWGLLDRVIAAGTPGQRQVVFHYGDETLRLTTSRPLYAPRRTVLDPILVAAAERAGAEFRFGVDVRDVLRDGNGAVSGVEVRDRRGTPSDVHGRVTVGADGRTSRIVQAVAPPVTRQGAARSAFVYGYWTDVPADGYEWCFRPGTTAGLIPTNGGETCVFVGMPPARFCAELRNDLPAAIDRVLAETTPAVAERVAAGRRYGRLRAHPGVPGWLRRPWGPGWVLVGDAGYYKDPTTAHGITDALRDAELLAQALHDTLVGTLPYDEALAGYERLRDHLSLPLFEATEAIASFRWDLAEVQRHHLVLSEAAQREVDVLAGLPSAVASAA